MSLEEQITSKDKYPSIFLKSSGGRSYNRGLNYPSNIFPNTWDLLKNGEYHSVFFSFSWRIFSHVTRLDQSFASKIFDGLLKDA